MTRPDDHARVSLSTDPSASGEYAAADDPPFCIVVLGDFSAGSASGTGLAERRAVPVESIEELLERVRPRLALDDGEGGTFALDVRSLDDLHPDALIERVPHLRALVEAIEPTAREQAARSAEPAGDAAGSPSPGRSEPPPAGLLDEIVQAAGDEPPVSRGRGPGSAELERWVDEAVAGHRVRSTTPAEEELRARLELEAGERVRDVLHAPPIRRLEALLRGVLFLAASIEDPARVRVLALDVSRAELQADLSGGDLAASGLLRSLVQPLPGACGASPPALLVGAWELGGDPGSLALLNRVAMVAHVVGVPLVAGAGPDLVGLQTFHGDTEREELEAPSPLWEAFRGTPAAGGVGLVAPPFLLRLPYGPDSDPSERLPFDEVGNGGAESCSWGNPAFVAAAAAAAGFHREGWGFDGRGEAEFGGRPTHAAPDGEPGIGATQCVWSATRAEEVRARGIMPLVAHRTEARMRLPGLVSVASTGGPLAAWWNGG